MFFFPGGSKKCKGMVDGKNIFIANSRVGFLADNRELSRV